MQYSDGYCILLFYFCRCPAFQCARDWNKLTIRKPDKSGIKLAGSNLFVIRIWMASEYRTKFLILNGFHFSFNQCSHIPAIWIVDFLKSGIQMNPVFRWMVFRWFSDGYCSNCIFKFNFAEFNECILFKIRHHFNHTYDCTQQVISAKLSLQRHSVFKTAYSSSFSAHSCEQQPKLHACAKENKHMLTNPQNISSQTFIILIKCQFIIWCDLIFLTINHCNILLWVHCGFNSIQVYLAF